MLNQTLEFQKSLYDSTFTIITSVQENCEDMLKNTLQLYPWIPEPGKQACLFLSDQYWQGVRQIKASSLLQLDYMESLLSPPEKKQEKKSGSVAKVTPVAPQKPAIDKTQTVAKTAAKPAKTATRRAPAPKTKPAAKRTSASATTKKPTTKRATAKKTTTTRAAAKKTATLKS